MVLDKLGSVLKSGINKISNAIFLDKKLIDGIIKDIQKALIEADVNIELVFDLSKKIKKLAYDETIKGIDKKEQLVKLIHDEILIILGGEKKELKLPKKASIMFTGINGSGKTTTIAKVANYLQKNKISVCLAAADTFRAAAIQQLEVHANKLKVPIIKKDYGADPASVGFDATTYAKKNKIDIVLIDTAGRMQNKDSLMQEMEKIARVNKPDMKIFLGESITGNDATEQAKAFNESIDITGIILSKADVDEKGGTAISVSSVTGKPILFLGTGQEYKDLEIFDKKELIKKLGL